MLSLSNASRFCRSPGRRRRGTRGISGQRACCNRFSPQGMGGRIRLSQVVRRDAGISSPCLSKIGKDKCRPPGLSLFLQVDSDWPVQTGDSKVATTIVFLYWLVRTVGHETRAFQEVVKTICLTSAFYMGNIHCKCLTYYHGYRRDFRGKQAFGSSYCTSP